MTHSQTRAWPLNVRLRREERTLEVEFDDGNKFRYSAEYLRVESPSAEVKGHGMSQKRIISGCSRVGIEALEPVGNYAVRIIFDDTHNSGIYSWDYLYELGEKRDEKWLRYLKMLESLGLSREPNK